MSKLTRFTVVPVKLFRIQSKLPVSLREYEKQVALGRSSWDLKVHNNLVLPMEGNTFHTPNGMSLRPAGENLETTVRNFKGPATIYAIHPGHELPKKLVLIHEHTDHYSMQVREPMTLAEFDKTLTEYLKSLPQQTKEQFIAELDDYDDQDN